MGETAADYTPDQTPDLILHEADTPEETGPTRRLGNLSLASSELESPIKYPTYTFRINEHHMLDRGVLVTSPFARVRESMRALSAVRPEYGELARPNPRDRALKKHQAYIKQKHITADEQKQVTAETFADMVEENHPAAQLIVQIINSYSDKLGVDKLQPLVDDLMSLTAWDRMQPRFQEIARNRKNGNT